MKAFFKTFGCKVNQYETELLRTRLERSGAASTEEISEADICLINSCSVTADADRECRQFIRKTLRENPRARVVVTGCYATRAPGEIKEISPRIEVYSNQEKDNLPSCFGFEIADQPLGITHFGERARAFLKIQDGCHAPCTYCIIPTVRPQLWNKPTSQVLEEARRLVAEGHQEIVLTGIRLGQYRSIAIPSPYEGEGGRRPGEGSIGLVALLQALLRLPGAFRIRLSSIEVTEVSEELIRLISNTLRICRHLHIPLQSGSDAVLKDMGRWYKSGDYKAKIEMIRTWLPDCGLTADVMVGFPTETDDLFIETARFIDNMGLSGLHVFPFSSRSGTKAALLKALPELVVANRSRILRGLDSQLRQRFLEKFRGLQREVLVEPSGEGWTDNYIRVKSPPQTPPGLVRLLVAA